MLQLLVILIPIYLRKQISTNIYHSSRNQILLHSSNQTSIWPIQDLPYLLLRDYSQQIFQCMPCFEGGPSGLMLQKYGFFQKNFETCIFISFASYDPHKPKKLSSKMHEAQKKITITATTPTRGLDSTEYVFSLLRATDYQVIPSHPASLAYDTDTLLLNILASRQHRDVLLDISLPYYFEQPGQPTLTYFGRYLIFNQVLIGVRLACAPQPIHMDPAPYPKGIKKWQAGIRAFHEVSPLIRKFYREERLESLGQVLVGDFSIRHRGIHIALPFESEIALMPNILSNYCQQGCGIISVVNDQPRLANFAEKLSYKTYRNRSRCENQLMQFGKKKSQVIMYCGMRMASPEGLYLAYSFIMDMGKLKQESVFLFNDGAAITQKVAITIKPLKMSDQQVYQISNDFGPSQKSIQKQEVTVEPVLNSNFCNLFHTMRAWYLYKEINKGCPFVLSLPLGPLCLKIFEEMKKISTHINFPLFNFISLYKRKGIIVQPCQEKHFGLHIYGNIQEYLAISAFKNVNIYTQDFEEEHEIGNLIAYYRQKYNIQLCHQFLQANNQNANIRSMINMVAQKCLSTSLTNMKDLVRMARQHKLSNTSMIELMNVLRCKLRMSPIATPFFHYIVYASDQALRAHMEDSELTLLSKDARSLIVGPTTSIEEKILMPVGGEYIDISDDQSRIIHNKNRRYESLFQKKMIQMKRFQQKQLKYKQHRCHSCKLLMQKQLSFSCQSCNIQTCNLCIEKVLQRPSKRREQYQICIVCNNLCMCEQCNKKLLDLLLPEQKYEQNRQAKREGCVVCEIEGRKSMRIQVVCDRCNKLMCYSCSRGKKNEKYMEWMCNECFKYAEQTLQKVQTSIPSSQTTSIQKKQIKDSSPKYQKNDRRDSRQRTRMKDKKRPKNNSSISNSHGISPKRQPTQHQNARKIKRVYYQKTNRRRSKSSSSSSESSSITSSKHQKKRKDSQPSPSRRAKRRLSRSQRRANQQIRQQRRRENQRNQQRQRLRRQERRKQQQWNDYLQRKQKQQRVGYQQNHTHGPIRQYNHFTKLQFKHFPTARGQIQQKQASVKQSKSLWAEPKKSTQYPTKAIRSFPIRTYQQRKGYNQRSPSSQYDFNEQYHY